MHVTYFDLSQDIDIFDGGVILVQAYPNLYFYAPLIQT